MPTEEVQKLRDVFATEGPRSAITYLNSLTSHRFTSAFRFDDGMLKSTFFYDRDNPGNSGCEEIPILASYCVFVRDFKVMFPVPNCALAVKLIFTEIESPYASVLAAPLYTTTT